MPEVFARLAFLPAKVKAVVVTRDNVTFMILVNESLCDTSRLHALQHELKHIYGDHFATETIPVGELERLANQLKPVIGAGFLRASPAEENR